MLEIRRKILLNGDIYDGYKILSMNIDFQTDNISIKVEYSAFNKKTTRDYKIEVGNEINLEDAIEQIHDIHKTMFFK